MTLLELIHAVGINLVNDSELYQELSRLLETVKEQ
jgi:hypothetical protein